MHGHRGVHRLFEAQGQKEEGKEMGIQCKFGFKEGTTARIQAPKRAPY